MPSPKTRYKAIIDGQTYTIIGHESKEHMVLVVRLVNEQLNEIKDNLEFFKQWNPIYINKKEK